MQGKDDTAAKPEGRRRRMRRAIYLTVSLIAVGTMAGMLSDDVLRFWHSLDDPAPRPPASVSLAAAPAVPTLPPPASPVEAPMADASRPEPPQASQDATPALTAALREAEDTIAALEKERDALANRVAELEDALAQARAGASPEAKGDGDAATAPAQPARPAAVAAARPAPAALDRGTIIWAQGVLRDLGHDVLPDGVLGPQTANAVRRFQTRHGLPATGSLDAATLDLLAREGGA